MHWIALQAALVKLKFPSLPEASSGLLGSQALPVAGSLEYTFTVTWVFRGVSNWPASFLFTVGMWMSHVPDISLCAAAQKCRWFWRPQHTLKMSWFRWHQEGS